MARYKVYIHTFPNGKRYIGITSQDVCRRWRKGQGYEGQVVYGAILKYGWKNIKHEVLFDNLTKQEAEEKEIALIRAFDTTSHKNGYNVELGGNATPKATKELRKKQSAAHKGLLAGENHWNYGKHLSAETRQKISRANMGKKVSKEQLLKMSQRAKGKNNPMYGTKMSAEHKEKLKLINELRVNPVICIETGEIYPSTKKAAEMTGICQRTIQYVCSRDKKYKKAGGFHWEYIERSK